MTNRPEVLFVCVHNAGRSQMAAAWLQHLAGDRVSVRSAGSAPADEINPAVREAMAEVGIDISREVPKKLTTEGVEAADVVITMGCGDACPVFPGKRYLDWKLDDPAGQGIDAVRPIRDEIKSRVEQLIAEIAPSDDIRETVRARYAQAAQAISSGCCGGNEELYRDGVFGASLYGEDADETVQGSLGCGVPTEVADLAEGETVLDLGSGTGGDVLISARRVGETGKVYGLDMTDEMLEQARANAERAGVQNVEFLKGYLEEIPLPDDSVDVALSNCVINLAADKRVVIREAARVLRPGGRVAFSDVIADPAMPDDVRADMQQWTGCIAGALSAGDFERFLSEAGFRDISVTPTHDVHEYAQAAIIRATLAS